MRVSKKCLMGLIVEYLRKHRRQFDICKRLSRGLGFTNELYEFLKKFSAVNKTCNFIQIGSNDGLANDPLREFVLSKRWKGILVEPVPYLFDRLIDNYKGIDGLYFEKGSSLCRARQYNLMDNSEEKLAGLPLWEISYK